SDDEVEARAGSSVEALFRERGEAAFRDLEARAMTEILRGSHRVVATGGGWPAAGPGRLETLPVDVLSVWLRVPAATAVLRVARGGSPRPLLAVDDPVGRARRLLERRTPAYRPARLHLDTVEASVVALADAIVERLTAVEDVRG
ncbi:MAG TPA: shikimate kinase, partial [Longimicrobiales bacterium]|nr:shikimate kinase [Longimicrobiales bacterium]